MQTNKQLVIDARSTIIKLRAYINGTGNGPNDSEMQFCLFTTAEDRLACDLTVDPIELNIAQTSGRACEIVGISRGQVVYIYASRVS